MREIEVDYMNINEVFSGLDKLFAENRLPEVERYLTQALSDAEYEKDTDSMLAIYNDRFSPHHGRTRQGTVFLQAGHEARS